MIILLLFISCIITRSSALTAINKIAKLTDGKKWAKVQMVIRNDLNLFHPYICEPKHCQYGELFFSLLLSTSRLDDNKSLCMNWIWLCIAGRQTGSSTWTWNTCVSFKECFIYFYFSLLYYSSVKFVTLLQGHVLSA